MGSNALARKIGIYSFFSTLTTTLVVFFLSIIFLPSSVYYSNKYEINYISIQLMEYAGRENYSNFDKVLEFAKKNNIDVYYYEGQNSNASVSKHLIYLESALELDLAKVEFVPHYVINANSDANMIIRENYFTYDDVPYTLAVAINKYSWMSFFNFLSLVFPIALYVSLVFGILNTIIFSKSITSRINRAIEKTSSYASLEFDIPKHKNKNDEFGVLVTNIDLMGEKLKRAFEELNSDLDKSKQLEKQRRDQLAIISHELKTPITILKGQIEMMIEKVGKYKDRDFYLKENIVLLDRMQKLINNILATTKLENMDAIVEKNSIVLDVFLQDIVSFLSKLHSDKKIIYEIDDFYEIVCNEVILTQVVKNILENAIKYSTSDEVTIIVKNSKLVVTNKTEVLKNEMIEKLYDPFKRLESSRNSKLGGHGIGMFIIKRGLELHGFEYKFSVVNNYATFEINFKGGINE